MDDVDKKKCILMKVFCPDTWMLPQKWQSDKKNHNSKVNISLVFGIIAVVIHIVPIFSIIAIVFGNTAKKEMLEQGESAGELKVEWGIALGKTGLVFFAVEILVLILWLSS